MSLDADVAGQPGPGQASRDRILAAAAQIAAEAGYEGTTIMKITQRSGLPVSSVYWFFKDKDELLAAVVQWSYQAWVAAQPTWTPVLPDTPWVEGLTTNLQTSLRGIGSAPHFLRIGHMLTLQTRTTESAARTLFLDIRTRVEQTITDWYSDNLPPLVTQSRPGLAGALARITMAATEGLFLAEQIDEPSDPDEFVAVLIAIVQAAVTDAA